MEIRSKNSITEYAAYRMKKSFWDFILTLLGILFLIFVLMESIYHLEWIRAGLLNVDNPNALNSFFYTVIAVTIVGILGLFALLIYLIYIFLSSYRKIRYYKEPRFSIIERKEIDYDYKLWQTAGKNTFHSQAISLSINGEEKLFKTPIIFTNSKRIGLFKIPKVLQSHSYVRGKCEIGYDAEKEEAVILSVTVE